MLVFLIRHFASLNRSMRDTTEYSTDIRYRLDMDAVEPDPRNGQFPESFEPQLAFPVQLVRIDQLPIKLPRQLGQGNSHLHVCQIDSEAASGAQREWLRRGKVVVLKLGVPERMPGGQPTLWVKAPCVVKIILTVGCGP